MLVGCCHFSDRTRTIILFSQIFVSGRQEKAYSITKVYSYAQKKKTSQTGGRLLRYSTTVLCISLIAVEIEVLSTKVQPAESADSSVCCFKYRCIVLIFSKYSTYLFFVGSVLKFFERLANRSMWVSSLER